MKDNNKLLRDLGQPAGLSLRKSVRTDLQAFRKQRKIKIFLLLLLASVISCTPGSQQSDLHGLVIPSRDLTDQFDIQLTLVDSFIYRMPEPDTLYNGRAYVFEGEMMYYHYHKKEILRFDREGNLLARMGGKGKGPGEFIRLNAVFADGEFVYGFDLVQDRMNVYDYSGKYIRDNPLKFDGGEINIYEEWSQIVQDNTGRFIAPVDWAFDGEDILANYQKPFIGLFNANWQLVDTFGQWAPVYTEFQFRRGQLEFHFLAYDEAENKLLVAEQASHLIDIYDGTGQLINQFGLPGKHMQQIDYASQKEVKGENSNRLYLETPIYYDIIATKDYFIRFYRAELTNPSPISLVLAKPLYYQIYNRDMDLIADRKAPENWFFYRGKSQGNMLWFSYEDLIWQGDPQKEMLDRFYQVVYGFQIR